MKLFFWFHLLLQTTSLFIKLGEVEVYKTASMLIQWTEWTIDKISNVDTSSLPLSSCAASKMESAVNKISIYKRMNPFFNKNFMQLKLCMICTVDWNCYFSGQKYFCF